MTPTAQARIAIVGAGVAGVTAAHRLREKGYRHITLFEREPSVGGKVCSFRHQGRVYELGALWSSPRYRLTNRFAREVGARRRGAGLPQVLEAGRLQDYGAYMWQRFGATQLAAELLRLGWALLTFPGIGQPHLRAPMAGCTDSFAQFARRAGFPRLAEMSRSLIAGCGYLDNASAPAPYLMKFMHIAVDVLLLDVLRLSRHRMAIHVQGWQAVWQALAQDHDLRLSSRITSIRRTECQDGPRIDVLADGRGEAFDRLIVAAPLDECGAFLDLGEEERALFARIRTNRYRVTLVEAQGLPHASFMDNAFRERIGHVNLIARQHADADVFSVYQQLGDQVTEEAADRLLHEDLAALGGRLSRRITSRTWKYFPHVSGEDLRDGFHARLDALQGTRGTCYVGGILHLETVEHTARSTVEIIDRKF